MSNVIVFALLGSAAAVGIWFGYSWDLVLAIAGAAMSSYALIKQEVSEGILRYIAREIRTLGELRKDLRGRLSGLMRSVRRPPSREPPGGRSLS